MTTPRPADTTLGELRARGWRSRTVKEELRSNLIASIGAGQPFLPGILGYEDTVLPQLENAILAGQDVILLGVFGLAGSGGRRGSITAQRASDTRGWLIPS